MMVNIPTELLRTLVSVVDQRSFTRAAQALGVTQPAVSAQIKRLQLLLDSEILDKSAPGVSLTPVGEIIVNHARRMLSINDHILGLATPRPPAQTIRVGIPGDVVSLDLPWTLADFKSRWPEVSFTARTGFSLTLLRQLKQGDLDLVVGLSTAPSPDALRQWPEEMVWIRGPKIQFGDEDRIPLVSCGDECIFHLIAVEALRKGGLLHDTVYASASLAGLSAAVDAGLGVMALPRKRSGIRGLTIWDDAPLPKLPDLHCGIYIRDGADHMMLDRLADAICEALQPQSQPHLGLSERRSTPALISF